MDVNECGRMRRFSAEPPRPPSNGTLYEIELGAWARSGKKPFAFSTWGLYVWWRRTWGVRGEARITNQLNVASTMNNVKMFIEKAAVQGLRVFHTGVGKHEIILVS